ncbi:Ser/Thr protein phosphatase [Pyricularia oryzae 70-15]|uniref:Ser/Thr protein phosphatase n=1 Tax=Pyricularia oryzae (strain 70-15 / ATCC MYA-4617 / FGSC 8958) TaxID=242507 RepID=G4MLN7_PYRO7|nr:Ser/Thr protein phosphatase [Pyricularia oryzae 70-15]EHA56870.1 Ser/Thr protein phosphatase [Pyricularia oryzae 70-15]
METSLSRELPFSQATVSFIGDQIDQGTKKNRNLTPAPRFQLRQLKVSDVAEPFPPPGLGDRCEAFSACVIGAMSNPASHNQTPKPARVRRTRFVCISDTHNHELKLPKGDVLIHAGDLTNQGTFSELSKAVRWLEKTDFEAKIVIAGNHDISLDAEFYQQYGTYFHNQRLESPPECIELLKSSPSITYLCQSSAKIRLSSPSGPRTEFTVFGSPYSPRNGLWAFSSRDPDLPDSSSTLSSTTAVASRSGTKHRKSKRPSEPAASFGPSAPQLWDAIPLSTDIIVTHTPPRRHCDGIGTHRGSLGCEALRRALWRVRPRLAVCGHVHEARGAETVRWDLDGGPQSLERDYKEKSVTVWEDTSGIGNKIALVNLTGDPRKGRTGLDNDGAIDTVLSQTDGTFSTEEGQGNSEACDVPELTRCAKSGNLQKPTPSGKESPTLAGSMSRRETCVVNCSVMANSYPHVGGKRFNKPIVIDLDLPTWEDV